MVIKPYHRRIFKLALIDIGLILVLYIIVLALLFMEGRAEASYVLIVLIGICLACLYFMQILLYYISYIKNYLKLSKTEFTVICREFTPTGYTVYIDDFTLHNISGVYNKDIDRPVLDMRTNTIYVPLSYDICERDYYLRYV